MKTFYQAVFWLAIIGFVIYKVNMARAQSVSSHPPSMPQQQQQQREYKRQAEEWVRRHERAEQILRERHERDRKFFGGAP